MPFTWIQLVLFLIQYGPKIYELLSEIFDLGKNIERKRGPVTAKNYKSSFYRALSAYRREKDRGPLRRLRDQMRRDLGYDD